MIFQEFSETESVLNKCHCLGRKNTHTPGRSTKGRLYVSNTTVGQLEEAFIGSNSILLADRVNTSSSFSAHVETDVN